MDLIGALAKLAAKTPHCGIFIRVPAKLARSFKKKEEDKSPPHVTLCYIGELTKGQFQTAMDVARGVASNVAPFTIHLTDYGEFENPEGKTIAHMIPRATELEPLHRRLTKAFRDAGLELKHHPGPLKPHVTLAYVDKGLTYDGARPSGRWRVTEIEAWSGEDRRTIPLTGTSNIHNGLVEKAAGFRDALSKYVGKFRGAARRVSEVTGDAAETASRSLKDRVSDRSLRRELEGYIKERGVKDVDVVLDPVESWTGSFYVPKQYRSEVGEFVPEWGQGRLSKALEGDRGLVMLGTQRATPFFGSGRAPQRTLRSIGAHEAGHAASMKGTREGFMDAQALLESAGLPGGAALGVGMASPALGATVGALSLLPRLSEEASATVRSLLMTSGKDRALKELALAQATYPLALAGRSAMAGAGWMSPWAKLLPFLRADKWIDEGQMLGAMPAAVARRSRAGGKARVRGLAAGLKKGAQMPQGSPERWGMGYHGKGMPKGSKPKGGTSSTTRRAPKALPDPFSGASAYVKKALAEMLGS